MQRLGSPPRGKQFVEFSHAYTSSEAYDDVVEMGNVIIGHVMSDYAKVQDGWYRELLHQIVHGHKGTSGIFPRIDFMSSGSIGLSINLILTLLKMVLDDGLFLVHLEGYSASDDFI